MNNSTNTNSNQHLMNLASFFINLLKIPLVIVLTFISLYFLFSFFIESKFNNTYKMLFDLFNSTSSDLFKLKNQSVTTNPDEEKIISLLNDLKRTIANKQELENLLYDVTQTVVKLKHDIVMLSENSPSIINWKTITAIVCVLSLFWIIARYETVLREETIHNLSLDIVGSKEQVTLLSNQLQQSLEIMEILHNQIASVDSKISRLILDLNTSLVSVNPNHLHEYLNRLISNANTNSNTFSIPQLASTSVLDIPLIDEIVVSQIISQVFNNF